MTQSPAIRALGNTGSEKPSTASLRAAMACSSKCARRASLDSAMRVDRPLPANCSSSARGATARDLTTRLGITACFRPLAPLLKAAHLEETLALLRRVATGATAAKVACAEIIWAAMLKVCVSGKVGKRADAKAPRYV
eukprot:1176542-Prorocentrum_minimum.AAC.2